MVPDKLKARYRKAFEQETDWGYSAPSSAKARHRYRGVIQLIEQDMLPLAADDVPFQAELFRDLGHAKGLIAQYDGAFDALGHAIEYYHAQNDTDELIACWTDMGNFQRDASLFEDALISYRKVIEFSEPVSAKRENTAEAYCGLADVYRLQGSFMLALENLERASELSATIASIDLEGNILWTRAYVLLNQGRFDEAAICYETMEQWCRDGSYNERDKAPTWAGLGDLYRMTGRCEEALALYAKADASMELQEDRTQRPWVLAVTALASLQLGRMPEARRAAIQAEYLSRRGDPMSVAWALQAKGEMHRLAGEPDLAQVAHEEALSISEQLGCRFETAHSRLALAVIDGDMDSIETAREAYSDMDTDWGTGVCDDVLKRMSNSDPIPPLNFP